ncbi:MAG: helix-turn-helix transcriptional regulator [Planctomycetota bacterium]
MTCQTGLRSLSVKYSPGYQIEWHEHSWSQFIYANAGAMTVAVGSDRWAVPPRRAIWVPASQRHRISMHGSVYLRTVYLECELACCEDLPCAVFDVDSLLHELVQHVCDRGIVRPENEDDVTLIRFFEQRLRTLKPIDAALQMPSDPRARRFAERLLEDPGGDETLDALAVACGTSLRTLQRLFRDDVGLSVGRWRHRVRMLRAIEMLGREEPVTQVALELGFESVSAFIHSFKQTYGETPGRYRS